MLFERIESQGLAHYSYLIGDQGEAIVIDPRRDVDVYAQTATRAGMRIAHVLETHRNEDYLIGSLELVARTGAQVWHADGMLDYQYGQPAQDGQTWRIGRLKMRAIHSPGHTLGSMSYLLHDPDGAPWVLFTGDALFAGEVGRVDFLGMDRAPEMAGHLYDTLSSCRWAIRSSFARPTAPALSAAAPSPSGSGPPSGWNCATTSVSSSPTGRNSSPTWPGSWKKSPTFGVWNA